MKGNITILVDREQTTIKVIDDISDVEFLEIVLTPEQLSMALSRLSHTHCEITTRGLDKIGKKHEHKSFEFPLPTHLNYWNAKREDIADYAQMLLDSDDEGWITDRYFGSKKSFFTKGDEKWARCTVRRWVENIES